MEGEFEIEENINPHRMWGLLDTAFIFQCPSLPLDADESVFASKTDPQRTTLASELSGRDSCFSSDLQSVQGSNGDSQHWRPPSFHFNVAAMIVAVISH